MRVNSFYNVSITLEEDDLIFLDKREKEEKYDLYIKYNDSILKVISPLKLEELPKKVDVNSAGSLRNNSNLPNLDSWYTYKFVKFLIDLDNYLV